MTIRGALCVLLCGAISLRAEEPQTPPRPLSPSESARAFTIADDLEIEQVLAEPLIAQPVFLNFDERGRMWVVEYRQYPHPAGLNVVSHDQFWRAVYDKLPLPPPHHVKGLDRITIHADTDGDGSFDQHKTFLDGLNIVTAVERGRGGVWVLNPPYLLFYADKNEDDVPDGDPVVHLAGFGLEDTHSVANSLRWGPDGWLYGAHGSTVTAHVTRPGSDAAPVYIQGQCVWRYHPETRRFEVFAEGGGNAFGLEIDAKGRIFSGHNGGDTRGFHYLQGAYMRKGFEKHGPLSNPYAFGFFEPMAHHRVERFTHNFVIYEGGLLPSHYVGKLIGIEPLQGRVVVSEVLRDGASFRTRDVARPVTSSDSWFKPVDIKAGPDGAIYICDWYAKEVNHARNMEGDYDASTGRVYRLKTKGAQISARTNLGKLSAEALVAELNSDNKWVRQTALRLLTDRHESTLAAGLEEKIAQSVGQSALEALWALHACGALDEKFALQMLNHSDPFVRLWTVRLVCDAEKVSSPLAAKIAALAKNESELDVRAQLASSAKRLPATDCLMVVEELTAHDEDVTDNHLPLLIWWALESNVSSNADEVLALFESSSMWRRPLVEKHLLERLMRRFAQAGTRRDLLACARLFHLSPDADHTRRLMAGFEAAFSGRAVSGLPQELIEEIGRHEVGSVTLGVRRSDERSIDEALRIIADGSAPEQTRLQYLTLFSEVSATKTLPTLLRLVATESNVSLRKAALNALQAHDDPRIPAVLLEQFGAFPPTVQSAALGVLAGRQSYARELANAVKNGKLMAEAVPLNVVRKMKSHKDAKLQKLVSEVWPQTGIASPAALEERIQKVSEVLRASGGDPYQGQLLFDVRCGSCHTLFGRGGKIGPDLTAFERGDMRAMLVSIVNPNAEIREGYEHLLVTTKNGRVVSGFLVDKDNQTIVVRGLDGENNVLSQDEVAEMVPAGISLMPEGLLDGLGDEQLRDLFAYLRSTQPLVPRSLLK